MGILTSIFFNPAESKIQMSRQASSHGESTVPRIFKCESRVGRRFMLENI